MRINGKMLYLNNQWIEADLDIYTPKTRQSPNQEIAIVIAPHGFEMNFGIRISKDEAIKLANEIIRAFGEVA